MTRGHEVEFCHVHGIKHGACQDSSEQQDKCLTGQCDHDHHKQDGTQIQ